MLYTRRTRRVASAPLKTMTRLCSSQNNDTLLQSRIMAMVKLWCQRFFVFGDFDDELFVDAFFDLLEKFEGIHAMQRVAVALKSDLMFRIQQRESGTDSAGGDPHHTLLQLQTAPYIIYPHDKFTAYCTPTPKLSTAFLHQFDTHIRYYRFDKNYRLQMWPAEEVARQLSLFEFSIFRKIQPKEMLNQAWSKKTRDQFAPNITADISHFNCISSLAAYSIVSVPDLQQRQRMYVTPSLPAHLCNPCLHAWMVDQACRVRAAAEQPQRRDADPVCAAKQQRVQASSTRCDSACSSVTPCAPG